jgi:hypothetical protein
MSTHAEQNEQKSKKRQRGLDEGAREMVSREVYYCVSSLVSEMASKPEYMDELMEVLQSRTDYEEAAMQEGWTRHEARMTGNVTYQKNGDKTAHMFDGWQDLCENEGIEPYQWEIYEHWIVSDWLAGELEEKGHAVIRDFYGLTIWGRPTTGQAIYIDGVIQEIYSEMMRPVQ